MTVLHPCGQPASHGGIACGGVSHLQCFKDELARRAPTAAGSALAPSMTLCFIHVHQWAEQRAREAAVAAAPAEVVKVQAKFQTDGSYVKPLALPTHRSGNPHPLWHAHAPLAGLYVVRIDCLAGYVGQACRGPGWPCVALRVCECVCVCVRVSPPVRMYLCTSKRVSRHVVCVHVCTCGDTVDRSPFLASADFHRVPPRQFRHRCPPTR
jgi:hypothetical protein